MNVLEGTNDLNEDGADNLERTGRIAFHKLIKRSALAVFGDDIVVG